MTYSVSELHDYLKTELPKEDNRLYGLAKHNHIGGVNESLFDTPHNVWTTPEFNPDTRFTTAIFNHVTPATSLVDILTMERPTGLFFRALTRAFERIADARLPNLVTVRLLMGKTAELGIIDVEGVIDEIAKALGQSRKGRIDFYVGQTRWEAASWNHAKTIAVDGKALIVGGHNLWAPPYLEKEPVFDVSMRMEGEATHGAHLFAESLWDFVRKNQGSAATYSHRLNPDLVLEKNKTPDKIEHKLVPHTGAVPVLWATCPGWGVFYDGKDMVLKDSELLCFVKGMSKATHCRMSLQDLGTEQMAGLTDFEEYQMKGQPYKLIACKGYYFILPVIDAIAEFLARPQHHPVEIVLTSPAKGGRDYSHRVPPSVIFNVISYRMSKHGLSKDECLKRFSQKLTLGSISFSQGRNRWPGGNNPIQNHAKFWMLDGKLTYIGSANKYPYVISIVKHLPGYHPEFGVIADLPQATARMIIDNYYGKLVQYAHRDRAVKEDLTWPESVAVAAAGE
jgi:hypothetical protein